MERGLRTLEVHQGEVAAGVQPKVAWREVVVDHPQGIVRVFHGECDVPGRRDHQRERDGVASLLGDGEHVAEAGESEARVMHMYRSRFGSVRQVSEPLQGRQSEGVALALSL